MVFLYTIWAKLNERKLKRIHTGLSKQQNLAIIEKIASEQPWSTKTNKSFYKEYIIPFALGHNGHKLTILTVDGEILFNLRNLGSGGRRMPYLLGIDTLKERSLNTKIKHYSVKEISSL